MEPSWAI